MPFPALTSAWLPRFLFGAQVVSTLALFGLVWFVQLVHYPLFLCIPPPAFAAYEAQHARRTGWIAAPLMVAELLSGLLLLSQPLRASFITIAAARLGASLAVLTWACTFLLQVPLHNRLHRGFNRDAIQRLVASNWLRTALWTARAALVAYWLLKLPALCVTR